MDVWVEEKKKRKESVLVEGKKEIESKKEKEKEIDRYEKWPDQYNEERGKQKKWVEIKWKEIYDSMVTILFNLTNCFE